jgi:hypothetical protein
MATITVTPGHTYGTTDTVTSTNLNNLGSPTATLTAGSILTADIADANVTKAKIENLSDYTVLGNVSGGAAAPAEVSILDEDDMASDSDTAIATQQSIKAYVDNFPGIKAHCVWDGTLTGTNAPIADLELHL